MSKLQRKATEDHSGFQESAAPASRQANSLSVAGDMHAEVASPARDLMAQMVETWRKGVGEARGLLDLLLRMPVRAAIVWGRREGGGKTKRNWAASRERVRSKLLETLEWRVMFRWEGKTYFAGYFDDENQAARAYDRAIYPLAGEFSRLNFPQSSDCG